MAWCYAYHEFPELEAMIMTSRVTVIVWHFTFYTEVNGTGRKKGIFTVDSLTRVITLVTTKVSFF